MRSWVEVRKMRKRLIMLLSVIMVIMLSGCETLLVDDELKGIKDHYEAYQDRNLDDFEDLATFINTATLETSRSSVKIKVSVYDEQREFVEERLASGIIFDEEAAYVHVMTAFHVTDVMQGYTKTVRIYDYLEREFTGFIREESDTLGISAIRMIKPMVNPLLPIELAEVPPIQGEPVLLIGFQSGIINAMTMGVITGLDIVIEEDQRTYMATDLPSDDFGDGAMIINLMHQLVGMQHHALIGEDIITYAMMLDAISAFIEEYEG